MYYAMGVARWDRGSGRRSTPRRARRVDRWATRVACGFGRARRARRLWAARAGSLPAGEKTTVGWDGI